MDLLLQLWMWKGWRWIYKNNLVVIINNKKVGYDLNVSLRNNKVTGLIIMK